MTTDAERAYKHAYYLAHRGRWAHSKFQPTYQLKRRYGITVAQYRKLLMRQDGRCAMCGSSEKRLTIDHNHVTGEVRGLLCHGCNTTVALAENQLRLARAMSYLNRAPEWQLEAAG